MARSGLTDQSYALVESEAAEIILTSDQAGAISSLGSALTSQKAWWGSAGQLATAPDRTAIFCQPVGDGRYIVRVDNAIGAFGIGNLTFVVSAKIPMHHAAFLMSKGGLLPRFNPSATSLADGYAFMELLATWFINQMKHVITGDLIRDYESHSGPVSSVRGRVDPLATASRFFSGALEFFCSYDDYTADNPYNRVLFEALKTVRASMSLAENIKREARRLMVFFTDVGRLRPSDLLVEVDRRSQHYADALILARSIIRSVALEMRPGGSPAWTFLIRTPEAIEAGVRNVLCDGLKPGIEVKKYGTRLTPSNMRIEPDLRFAPMGAVGDCKYKIYRGDWNRPDLYQSVAFAAGTMSKKSCIISFADGPTKGLGDVNFGEITTRHLVWDTCAEDPGQAAQQLIVDCRAWLIP